MSWDLVISVVSKVAELFIDPIGRQIGYVFNYQTNINNLKHEAQKLKYAQERVQIDVDKATRNGDEIYADVLAWLASVDGFVEQAEKIAKDEEDKAKTRCFKGWCPNLKTRYKLSRKAKNQTQVTVQTRKEGDFDRVSYRNPLEVIIPVRGFEEFQSRASVLENIMDALKDADVNLIGVYGMSGLGKTTLAEEVAFRAKKDSMFKSVVMVTVTHRVDVKSIQQEIAEKLDFKIDAESIDVRAARLTKRIQAEEKILVILDDIWEVVKFEKIGIPYANCKISMTSGDQNGNDHKCCKILMTSRVQNVFLEMDVQKDFRLESLKCQEALHLFQKTVGGFKDSNLLSIASDIAERCLGLPVLIVTIGSGLKNKDIFEWNDALEKLKTFDHKTIQERVYKALELSYNFLEDDVKSLFRLCVQLPANNICIEHLLRYGMGLGLFDQCGSVRAARNRLLKVISDLKRCCLLLEGKDEIVVKMHDAVHRFVINVVSKDHGGFIMTYDRNLEELLEKDKFNHYTAICILLCKKVQKFLEVLECPNLLSFIFSEHDPSVRIPERIFNGMKELKLLDLSDLHLSPMPTSLHCLENLQTLCLERCFLEEITIIGELKKLQVLSFQDSTIIQLPKQVGNLTCLRLLDLSRCRKLEVIPAGVLSRLTRLEELYMGDSFVQWEEEGHISTGNNANLGELKILSNLAILEMQVIDAKLWPDGILFEKLDEFKIFIGENWSWSGKYETSKTLKLQIHTSIQLRRVKGLLKRAEDVNLDDMKGVRCVLYDLDYQGFPAMKHLHVQNSEDIRYIMDDKSRYSSHVAFPKLESLTLDYLVSLEKICHGGIKEESFGKLRKLDVRNCDRLKNLLSIPTTRRFVKLEEVYVSSCKTMEEIVGKETEDESGYDEEIEFPQLCSLILESLPQLMSFKSLLRVSSAGTTQTSFPEIESADEPEIPVPLFDRKIILPHLEELQLINIQVKKIWSKHLIQQSHCIQSLTTLIVNGCENLNYLFTSYMIYNLTQLKKFEICDCKSMKEIITTSPTRSGEEIMDNVFFPKLQSLKLKNLPKLIRFGATNLIDCPSLKLVQIQSCNELKSFISNSTNSNEQVLFNQKVVFPKLEELSVKYMNNLKMIWHDGFHANSLKVLVLENINEMLKICESGHLKNLESLIVEQCDLLEEVFDDHFQLEPNKLRTLDLRDLPHLKQIWKWNEDLSQAISFEKLSSIRVYNCRSLRSLFPVFIARHLPQLEDLHISNCGLEYIVSKEENMQTTPHFSFPRLKTFFLWRLENLKSLYLGIYTLECPQLQRLVTYHCDKLKIFSTKQEDMHQRNMEIGEAIQAEQPLFSFKEVVSNLDALGLNSKDATILLHDQFPDIRFHQLKILQLLCFYDTLANFPFHLLYKFPNLEDLGLKHCYFKEIVTSSTAVEHANVLAQIRFLSLISLPEMTYIWNQDCQPDQLLPNLQILHVRSCKKLVNLAPSSISFANLTDLVVDRCGRLTKLVTNTTAKGMVNLTTMSISYCELMTEIVTNEGDECQSCCMVVFNKLARLKLVSLSSLTCFSPSASCIFKFPSLEEVIVICCPKMKVFSQGVISSPNLEKVHVTEEMDKWHWRKDLNTTIQHLYADMVQFNGIRQLQLSEFPELKSVWHQKSIPASLFARLNKLAVDEYEISSHAVPSYFLPFLSELEELEVRNCDAVEEVFGPEWPEDNGQSGHLPMLRKLHLMDLPRLRNAWPEVADRFLDLKSLTGLKIRNCNSLRNVFTAGLCLGLLEKLEICDCQALAEVIAPQRSGDGGMTTASHIQLPKLEFLKLKNLSKLKSFYGGNLIEVPSLKILQVESCTRMKTFVSDWMGAEVEGRDGPGLANCVLFDEKVVFPKLEELHVKYMNNLKMIWHDGSHANSLKVLVLENVNEMLKICESRHLKDLESLTVKQCGLLEEVFDDHFQLEPNKLRTLDLRDLPHLKQIWKWNEDLSQAISFEKLSSITIWNCRSLKSIFPVFIARNLPQLEYLYIANCGLEYIVSKEENMQTTPHFSFPQLKTFYLRDLEDLKSFYLGIYTLECPQLQRLVTYHCDKLKIFTPNQEDMHQINMEIGEAIQVEQPLFSFKEVVPNLVELGLNSTNATILLHDQFADIHFHQLQILQLLCLYDILANFPFHLLYKFPNLKTLVLKHCYFKEIITSSTAVEHANVLAQIRFLRLDCLPEMTHIWNQDCQPDHLLPNLQILKVLSCKQLLNLAPSLISFANLTTLKVKRCGRLINLVTNTTAKGMVNLTTMSIRECELMTEIVANEGDECQSCCEVVFNKLARLKLVGLSSLTCFSASASCIFKFPSLEEVIVIGCPKMKVFSQGIISSPNLEKVHVTKEMDKWHWRKDLNTTIQNLYAEMENGETCVEE